MPDHYAKCHRAVTLNLVGDLIRDLKAGWRPGLQVDSALVPVEQEVASIPIEEDCAVDAEVEADATPDRTESVTADGFVLVGGKEDAAPEDDSFPEPYAEFYEIITDSGFGATVVHAQSLTDARLAACAQMRHRPLSSMKAVGPVPSKPICKHCIVRRPELKGLVET